MTKILLDPVDFDALHLSALAFGGIGAGATFQEFEPFCATGHAAWLDGVEGQRSAGWPSNTAMVVRCKRAGLNPWKNDAAIGAVTNLYGYRMPFEQYIQAANIDIAEGD